MWNVVCCVCVRECVCERERERERERVLLFLFLLLLLLLLCGRFIFSTVSDSLKPGVTVINSRDFSSILPC